MYTSSDFDLVQQYYQNCSQWPMQDSDHTTDTSDSDSR